MNAKHHLLCKCLACMSKNVLPDDVLVIDGTPHDNPVKLKRVYRDHAEGFTSATWDTSATKATHPDTCECITCQRYNMAMMRIEALRDVRALWRAFFQIACRSEVRK